MIKFFYPLILLLLANNFAFAQANKLSFGTSNPIEFLDTIKTSVGEVFVIKDKLSDWSSDFADINYTVGVFTKADFSDKRNIVFEKNVGGLEYKTGNLKYFKSDIINIKSNVIPGVNPGDYAVQLTTSINAPGVYYFVGLIKGKSEHGNYFEDAGYWIVNCLQRAVNKPLNSFNIKDTYRFGEPLSFDFSIDNPEMDKVSGYHYKVFSGDKEMFSGIGSYVNLDMITHNPSLVNKSFRIEGYYGGNIVKYFNPSLPGTDSTVWNFKLLPPEEFAAASNWMTQEEFNNLGEDDVIDALDLNLDKNMKFRFMYYTLTPDGAIITKPAFYNLTIASSPEEFLTKSKSNVKIYDEGIWKVIEPVVNKKFLGSIKENHTKKVTLTIKFKTQFGEQKEFTFVGYVF